MTGRGMRLWADPIVDEFPMLFREGFEKAFERFFKDPWLAGRRREGENLLMAFTPRLDISETEREFIVTAELPGLEEKDVQVEVSGDTLILRGEKKVEREDKSKNATWTERAYGSFQRRIPLEGEVDPDGITAAMKQGVLTIKLPKSDQSKQHKKIDIKKA